MPPPAWYVRTFNQDYLDVYGEHLSRRTALELDGLKRLCPMAPGSRLLDLGCGHGRHCIPLALQGYAVTGVDLSALFLRQARRAAREAGVKVRWLRADMRQLKFTSEFDIVTSFYQSFGYFDSDRHNEAVAVGVCRALAPGGMFFLDLLGLQGIQRHLGSSQVATDGMVFQETVAFCRHTRRLTLDQLIRRPEGEPKTYRHILRLYEPEELRGMLQRAGLKSMGQWGGFDGCPVDSGDRLITLARRAN